MSRRRKYVTDEQKKEANLKKSREFYRKNKEYINAKKRERYQKDKLDNIESIDEEENIEPYGE